MEFDADTTQPGLLMGTPEFMAPEQVTRPEMVDCRADIYAFGVLLYEMLVGHCPFASEDPRRVLYQIVYEAPPPLDRPVPAALERLLFGGLLVKSRKDRLQSMAEVIAILDTLIDERPSVPYALASFDEPELANGSGSRLLPTRGYPAVLPSPELMFDEPERLPAPPWEVEVWP